MRCSYSMPSAFICATASPLAWLRWAASTWRGSSSVASITETRSRAYVGRLEVEQVERRQRERRQRLVEREVARQVDREADRAALGVGLGAAARRRRPP
jgi:hypothetical protein